MNPDSVLDFCSKVVVNIGSSDEVQMVFKLLQRQFSVSDLVTVSPKFIFVLESPHTKELECGAPVSGLSGVAMSKALLGLTAPFGLLLKEHIAGHFIHPLLDSIGVINVSSFPLQLFPVSGFMDGNADWFVKAEPFYDMASQLRSRNGVTCYRDTRLNFLQSLLVAGLKERMSPYVGKVRWIPCGAFAQKFVELTLGREREDVIPSIPHPSMNNWSKRQYVERVKDIKELIFRECLTDRL